MAMNKPKIQGTDDRPITASDCTVASYEDDLNNKIVVIKPEVLRREYRRATCQLKLCTGGFGAYLFAAVVQPASASTSIPEKRAGMSGWTFSASWNRKLPGWAKHGAARLFGRNGRKRTAQRRKGGTMNDGCSYQSRICHHGFLSCR
ncbi:MAG: hypothetical protein ACLTLQ_10855 [[Clostridium] scindens]